jgi:hypothetical protein
MQVAIEDKEHEMMAAVKALGPGWHDRQDIADHMGKNRLNPAEVTVLDVLVMTGKLEKALQTGDQPHVNRWVYRIKS